MSFIRWAPTFLGFPLAGLLTILVVGSAGGPLTAAVAGALAGMVIGAVQWLALGKAGSWRWLVGTAVGMAVGSSLSAIATGGATTTVAAIATGLIAGVAVGAGQGLALGRGIRIAALWAATVSLSWAVGWFITANVIVDLDSGFISFGASGAIVVTVITGLVLRRILGPRPQRVRSSVDQPVAESVR